MTSGSVISLGWAGATTLAAPALRLLLRYRAARGKEVGGRLAERRGIEARPRPSGPLIWLHAASVGETMSILPVLSALADLASDTNVLLTTGTVTSANLLARRLPEMGLAANVAHRFIPLDVPAWVGRFLDHWRPDAAGFVESELWPNILSACGTRGIPAMLINARMSARSHAAWSRAPWAAQFVLRRFARIQARGEEDAGRLRALGAGRVEVAGDLKLAADALPADPESLREMRDRLAGRPVFLAASTHPGEETLIQKVHDELCQSFPGLVTIIVPRHPERGPELAAVLHAPSRQRGQPPPAEGVWIADTLGELGLWYRLGQIAFIGRSLVPPGGGQNPLEPARLGCAIATGPQTSNFTSHVELLRASHALEVTPDVHALSRFVGTMLADPEARSRMGDRAMAAVNVPATLPYQTAQALLGLVTRTPPPDDGSDVT
jgi:3-deoxy-D-manno-octulosonic-acid transferase